VDRGAISGTVKDSTNALLQALVSKSERMAVQQSPTPRVNS
jgi:hypothetical protein